MSLSPNITKAVSAVVVALITVSALFFSRIFKSKAGRTIGELFLDQGSDVIRDKLSSDPEDEEPPSKILPVRPWTGHTGKGGLNLTLLDALDESWKAYFLQAVNDWELRSNPSPLNLIIKDAQIVENSCSHELHTLRFCNGNYGETNLKAGTIFVYDSNYHIQSAIVLLNDYFLPYMTEAEKKYLLCHQLGHGFGLPHIDMSSQTKEKSCLQPTNNFEEHTKPSFDNCMRLVKTYGVFNKHHRMLRFNPSSQISQESIPLKGPSQSILDLLKRKVHSFQQGMQNEGWIMIVNHTQHEKHIIDLGEGYHGEISLLLASN